MVKQGDIIKLNFSPATGHEQRGYRPAVVVSSNYIISKTNVIYVAPITSATKNFPLHVALDGRTKTKGEILCQQMKAVDLIARQFTYVEHLPEDIFEKVLTCVFACFEETEG